MTAKPPRRAFLVVLRPEDRLALFRWFLVQPVEVNAAQLYVWERMPTFGWRVIEAIARETFPKGIASR